MAGRYHYDVELDEVSSRRDDLMTRCVNVSAVVMSSTAMFLQLVVR